MIGAALSSLANFLGGERCYLAEMENSKEMVTFDTVESENWNLSTTITNYSVEKGKDISDSHVKAKPETISIKATLTNHTGISILDPMSLSRIRGTEVEDIISKSLERLKRWSETGVKLIYSGSIKEPASNFYLTNFSPSKSSGTGDAIDLNLTLTKGDAADDLEGETSGLGSLQQIVKKGLANTVKVVAAISLTNSNILMGE